MTENSNVKVMIAFNDPRLDNEELEMEAQSLLVQMKNLDEVDRIERVLDPNPPEGNKSMGGILVGLLAAEVSKENAKKFMGFLADRLGNKPIELEVEANGKKLKVKASSQIELKAAIKAAEDFIG